MSFNYDKTRCIGRPGRSGATVGLLRAEPGEQRGDERVDFFHGTCWEDPGKWSEHVWKCRKNAGNM